MQIQLLFTLTVSATGFSSPTFVAAFVELVIVSIITNTPPLEQGKQNYIYVIMSFLYIQYVSDLFVCLILTDQNKS